MTAFAPELFYFDSSQNLVVNPSDTTGLTPAFEDDEFEYIKAETCGAACCGGNWSLSVQTFFSHSGGLFGISRFVIDTSIPLMDALTINSTFEAPDSLTIGWDFTF